MKTLEDKIKHREYMRNYYRRPYVKERAKQRIRKGKYICKFCFIEFRADPSEESKYCSQKCFWTYLKLNPPSVLEKTQLKKRGRLFKGKISSYNSLHNWVRKNLGKPTFCKICGVSDKVEWANKSGKYLKNLLDWINLCKKCHFAYDRQYERMYT